MACACSSMAKVNVSQVKTAEVTRVGTIGVVEDIKSVQRVGFEIWRADQVDDQGIRAEGNWRTLASVGVAIINTLMAYKIAKLQWEIAAKYRDMFMQDHNRYMNNYYPSENKYMLEVGNKPIYKEDYSGRGKLYESYASGSFKTADMWGDLATTQIPLCVDPSLVRARHLNQDILSSAAKDVAYRQEDADKILHDDLRFKWRSDALDRGRSLVVNSAQMGNKAASIYGGLGQAIGQAAEGAAGALGYFGARSNRGLPTGVTSYGAVDTSHQEVGTEAGNLPSVDGLTNPRLNNRIS